MNASVCLLASNVFLSRISYSE